MRRVVLYCPHLGRDLEPLKAAVPELEVYTGQPTTRGEDGCLLNHTSVIATAQARGDEAIFVMEDDCQLTPHFSLDRWFADAAWAQQQGYDVLAGGCTRTYNQRSVRDGIVEVSAFHSAHCVVYFASGFARAVTAVQPYDLSLGKDCGLRCALVWPFVAVQRPSYSGILRQWVNYLPHYHAHEAELGRQFGWTVAA